MDTQTLTLHNLAVAQARVKEASIEAKTKLLEVDLMPGKGTTYLLPNRSQAYFDRGIIKALNEYTVEQLKAPFDSSQGKKILATLTQYLSEKKEDTLSLQLTIEDTENHPEIISIHLNDPKAVGLDTVEPKGNFICLKITPTSINCFLDNFAAPDSPFQDGSSFKGYIAFKFTWAIMRLFRKEGMFLGDGATQLCACDSQHNTSLNIRSSRQKSWYEFQDASHVETEVLFESCADCLGISQKEIDEIRKDFSTITHESYEAAKKFFRTVAIGQLYKSFKTLSNRFKKAGEMVKCLDKIREKLGHQFKADISLHDFIAALQKDAARHELFHELTNRLFRNQDTFVLELTHAGIIKNPVFNTFSIHQLANILVALNKPTFPFINQGLIFDCLLEVANHPSSLSNNYIQEHKGLVMKSSEALFNSCTERASNQSANAKINSTTTPERLKSILHTSVALDYEIDLEYLIPAIQTAFKLCPIEDGKPLSVVSLKKLNAQLFEKISERFCKLANSIDKQDAYTFYETFLYARFILDACNVFKTEILKNP